MESLNSDMQNSHEVQNEKIDILFKWFQKEEDLPPCIDKKVIEKFLSLCDNDLDKTKQLMLINYKLRNSNPHIFLERDPLSTKAVAQLEREATIILPGLTPDGHKVTILKLYGHNPIDKYDFDESVRLFIMMFDTRCLYNDPVGESKGEITIFDMSGYTLKLLAKSKISTIRILIKFVQEAITAKLKQIHIINALSFLDNVMMMVKPFMKKQIFDLIKIHHSNTDTIFNYVPKSMFPDEYGGQAGKIADIKNEWIDRMQNNRKYLTELKYWKIGEEKDLVNCKEKVNQNFNVNFLSLSLD